MSNKEELAKEYRLKAVLNTERYLEGGSNIEKAYIAGWDAAVKETINYLEILMERNSLPLGLQKAIVKELKHFVMKE